MEKCIRNGFIYDLESTGKEGIRITDPGHQCLQICVRAPQGDLFSSYIRPTVTWIPKESIDIHGITLEKVQKSPTFPQMWTRLLTWFQEVGRKGRHSTKTIHLIAHNNKHFDWILLSVECKRHGISIPSWIIPLDTLPYFKRNYPERKRISPQLRPFNLGNLHQALLGRPLVNAHDAVADVNGLCALILRTNAPFLREDSVVRWPLDKGSLIDLRWVGKKRAITMDLYFQGCFPDNQWNEHQYSIGYLRQSFPTLPSMENFLRKQIKITNDGQVMNLLSQLFQIPLWEINFPTIRTTYSDVDSIDQEKLIKYGIRCESNLISLYYYYFKEKKGHLKEYLLKEVGISHQTLQHLFKKSKKYIL